MTPSAAARCAAVVVSLVAFSTPPARAESPHAVRDATPDVAAVFPNTSEPFVLDRGGGVLATSGRAGIHLREDRGRAWRRSMRGFLDATGVEPFAAGFCRAPSAARTVYAVSLGEGILLRDRLFRSDDFGRSWRGLAETATVFSADCAVDPRDEDAVYFLTSTDAFQALLLKSTDGGQSFAQVGAGLEALDGPVAVRVAPTDPRKVYVVDLGTFAGVYASTDAGATFAPLASAPFGASALYPDPARDGTLFAVVPGDGLYRSDDRGASFASVAGVPPSVAALAFDPADARVIYAAAGLDGLFRSSDGGASFERVAGPAPGQLGFTGVQTVAVAPSHGRRDTVYVGTGLGPHRSEDGGATFTPILDGYRGAAVNDLALDAAGRLLVGVFHTVALFRGDAPGRPGEYQIVGAGVPVPSGQRDTVAVAASPADPDLLLVWALGVGLSRTEDGGRTWSAPIAGVPSPSSAARMAFAPTDARRVYLASHRAGLFRSDDAGRSFRLTIPATFATIAVDPRDADVLYLGTWLLGSSGGGLFKSTDGGETVTNLGQLGDFSAIAIDPAAPETVYAGSRQGGVIRSRDGGATWAPAGAGIPGGEVLGVAVDPQHTSHVLAWIKAEGLFRSDDGGETWRAADTGEALRRSAVVGGRAALVVDPVVAGRVYLGNSGVIQIDTGP